jgi:hypothetical protein
MRGASEFPRLLSARSWSGRLGSSRLDLAWRMRRRVFIVPTPAAALAGYRPVFPPRPQDVDCGGRAAGETFPPKVHGVCPGYELHWRAGPGATTTSG